jgi:hypothetical protein
MKTILALLLAIIPAFAFAAEPAETSFWAVNHAPAAAAQATIGQAANANGRHVAKSVTVCVAAAGTAQTPLQFSLRDGATGAGTVLWTVRLSAPINSSDCISLPITIAGTKNTAMTLESAGVTVAGAFAMVSLTGYTTF